MCTHAHTCTHTYTSLPHIFTTRDAYFYHCMEMFQMSAVKQNSTLSAVQQFWKILKNTVVTGSVDKMLPSVLSL